MLTGAELWHVIEHIIPVYAIVLLGYILFKLEIIQPVHMPGISRWISIIGVPAYVIHLLAFNDPYKISLRLVGADALQKLVTVMIGCLWWKFAKSGLVDHVITFFMLATLPNTVLIGDALLDPLYGVGIHGEVVTIIFLQAVLWYNCVIAMYELRIVLLDLQAKEASQLQSGLERDEEKHRICSRKPMSNVIVDSSLGFPPSSGHEMIQKSGFPSDQISDSAAVERTSSAPPRLSIPRVVPCTDEDDHRRRSTAEHKNDVVSISRKSSRQGSDDQDAQQEARVDIQDGQAEVQNSGDLHNLAFATLVFVKVVNRLKYAPLTYSSIIGFTYSLLAYKYHWTMPYYVRTSLELISDGAVGVALFILGTTWAASGRLISCGFKTMTRGMVIRFFVGPIIMVITSLAVGLRRNNFRFAVLQAVLPQGVISFVLAKEYNLDVNEFATAVIFQLIIFLPFVIVYYIVLEKV